jgi:hypothetical protein
MMQDARVSHVLAMTCTREDDDNEDDDEDDDGEEEEEEEEEEEDRVGEENDAFVSRKGSLVT